MWMRGPLERMLCSLGFCSRAREAGASSSEERSPSESPVLGPTGGFMVPLVAAAMVRRVYLPPVCFCTYPGEACS
jgi:hypothetical protein